MDRAQPSAAEPFPELDPVREVCDASKYAGRALAVIPGRSHADSNSGYQIGIPSDGLEPLAADIATHAIVVFRIHGGRAGGGVHVHAQLVAR